MKKKLLAILLFISIAGFSQQNVIKVGLSGLNYGDMALSYERALNSKSSLNYNIGVLNPKIGSIDFMTLFYSEGGLDLTELGTGFHTSIEYRSYIGKKGATRGFYMSPFLRFWNYKFMMSDEIDKLDFNVDTKVSSVGIGFQMGYQWIIYDRISIDWYFMGLSVEKMNLNATYGIDNESFNYSSIEDNVRDVFSDFRFIEKRLQTTVNDDDLKVKLPIILPGIKTGFTIGYAF